MGATTKYYAKVPRIFYEWIEVSAVTESDVRGEWPEAIEILHWSEFEERMNEEN